MGLRLHQTAKRRNGERVPTLSHAYCPFDVRVLDKAGRTYKTINLPELIPGHL